MSLELVEVDRAEQTLQEEKFKPTVFSPDWLRVSLQSFRGTLQNDCQQGRFDFVLYDYEANTDHRIPILSAPRDISIENVEMVQVSELEWKISWGEEQPLKNRRILLMPAWQPWQEPWEIKLPDEARGEYILENVAHSANQVSDLFLYCSCLGASPIYAARRYACIRHRFDRPA